jgi:hypothetical protein
MFDASRKETRAQCLYTLVYLGFHLIIILVPQKWKLLGARSELSGGWKRYFQQSAEKLLTEFWGTHGILLQFSDHRAAVNAFVIVQHHDTKKKHSR